ncbi:MAG: DUF362 domain-containing protein [Deltaproteobacteria bacterium]|nr:DUF362 domain-containing protein [Deltaproteobacteria bacterium]
MSEDQNKKTPRIALRACADYEPQRLAGCLEALLGDLGWIADRVRGRRVLLKPNFLVARKPERAVNTHPQLIRAMAAHVLEAGARQVLVADSPAVGSARRVARRLGLIELLAPLGVEVVELDEEVEVELPGARFPRLRLARRIVEAELVINLAKLKTHGLCGLTAAVKNCFGAVVGLGKARWHMRCGHDPRAFGELIVEVCRAVSPALSVVDAVVAMDGNGPGSGRPRALGLLAASTNPFALDRVLACVCGIGADCPQVLTFAADGLPDPGRAELVGDAPGRFALGDWQMPRADRTRISRALSGLSGRLLRRSVAPAPRFVHRDCTRCGQCIAICPAGALSLDGRRVRLADRLCVRCYCCQEICPEGAIRLRRGVLGR